MPPTDAIHGDHAISEQNFPRLRGDVVFLEVDTGAYLRSTDETFLLKGAGAYRWVSAILPMLTGENSVSEMCAGLDDARRRSVLSVVGTLVDKGMVRLSGTRRDPRDDFDAQRGYVEHFVGDDEDAAVAMEGFRAAHVLVLGGRGVASVVGGLLLNGARQVTVRSADPTQTRVAISAVCESIEPGRQWPPVVVEPLEAGGLQDLLGVDAVVVDVDADEVGLLREVTAQLFQGEARTAVRLVPVVRVADRAFVGPLARPGQPGCWMCVQMRIFTNSGGTATEILHALAFPSAPTRFRSPTSTTVAVEMVGNEAAFLLFRALTRVQDERLHDTVLVQDLETLESRSAVVVPHPRCPMCCGARPPTPTAVEHRPPSGFDLERLIDPDTGLLSSWSDDDIDQVPVKVGRIDYYLEDTTGCPRKHSACGYDLEDVLAARDRAARDALVELANTTPQLTPADPSLRRLPGGRIEGRRARLGPADEVADDAQRWVMATSLTDGTAMAVPADALDGRSRPNGRFERTTLGVAAGDDLADATSNAVGSALAFRGLDAALLGTDPACSLAADVLEDVEVAYLLRTLAHSGRQARLLSLPAAEPAFAVVAHVEALDPTGPGVWVVSAGVDLVATTRRALTDVVGAVISGQQLKSAWPAVDPRRLVAAPPDRDRRLTARVAHSSPAGVVDLTPAEVSRVGSVRVVRVLLEAG